MIKTFYSYYRSSAAYRVRIALNLKRVAPQETVYINLREGKHHEAEYADINPAHAVPAIVLSNGAILTQSMAILEWLEEVYPKPALLPRDGTVKAQVRAFAQQIVSDIHPLNNLRVLNYLHRNLNLDDQARSDWYHHWIQEGLAALELFLLQRKYHTVYCFGNEPSFADICLVPQVYNAERFNVDLTPYPVLMEIVANCLQNPAFAGATPENQPDCPPDLRK
jgi:maleylpyruvate isomerase